MSTPDNRLKDKEAFFAAYIGQRVLKVTPDAPATQILDISFLNKSVYILDFPILSLRSIRKLILLAMVNVGGYYYNTFVRVSGIRGVRHLKSILLKAKR